MQPQVQVSESTLNTEERLHKSEPWQGSKCLDL